jgi:hypothetical protein
LQPSRTAASTEQAADGKYSANLYKLFGVNYLGRFDDNYLGRLADI